MKMNLRIKEKWIAALRSGKYKQTRQCLGYRGSDQEETFCALGVLCEVALEEGIVQRRVQGGHSTGDYVYFVPSEQFPDTTKESSAATLIPTIQQWAGIKRDNPVLVYRVEDGHPIKDAISALNDSNRLDFNRLADLIEEQL